jgi:DNA-directed RNA polymerase subunit RPC12/RpoP
LKEYNCKNCGAILYWNPTSSCLECEYCGQKFLPSDFAEEENQAEKEAEQNKDFTPEEADENMTATDESDSGDLVVYRCSHCNAEVVTSRSTIATVCAFCGEALSITNKMVDNFRPDCVIPFKITKEEAVKLFEEYAKKGVLTPKDFSKIKEVEKVKGMYAPFWLHSFKNDSTAIVTAIKRDSTRRGYDKIEKQHIYEIDIDSTANFENVPADALRNISDELMSSVEPFDYSTLDKFSPAYMTGFYAEEYNEDGETTFTKAKERADKAMQEKIISCVKGYSSTSVKTYNSNISNRSKKYTMLPVWLFNVKYNGQNFSFAINGQTGKVAGKLPKCKKLMIKYGVITFLVTQILAFLVRLAIVLMV